MKGCGTCHPPADDTRDREILDRFRDFLAMAGRPATKSAPRYRTPAERYRVRFAAWWIGQVPADPPHPRTP